MFECAASNDDRVRNQKLVADIGLNLMNATKKESNRSVRRTIDGVRSPVTILESHAKLAESRRTPILR
jgi:hypothetical protein